MSSNQYIAISLSAMAAGSALSAAVICFFTSNPQPVVAMGVIGISCLLSAASTAIVAFGSKAQFDRSDKRISDTNAWFLEWQGRHEHEHELDKLSRDRSEGDLNNLVSRRMDCIESSNKRLEEKVDNMTAFIERTIAANIDQR